MGTTEIHAGGNSLATNDVLIVQDCERVLLAVDRVVAQIDMQPVQVMIEAVILSVTLTDDMEFGVNFASAAFNGQMANVFGNGALLNSAAGFTPATAVATAASISSAVTSGATGNPGPLATPGQLSSALSANEHGYKFGYSSNSITAFIRALESRTDVKVLASPRLLVVNKQRATLQVGDTLGYTTSTSNMGVTTQTANFMEVGTQLRLRPFVTSDGIIRMEIHPENSTGALNSAGIPQTTGAQVTTNVMVPDGRTVVIGGLIEADRTYQKSGIPVLCDIPWIGGLFRQTVDTPVRQGDDRHSDASYLEPKRADAVQLPGNAAVHRSGQGGPLWPCADARTRALTFSPNGVPSVTLSTSRKRNKSCFAQGGSRAVFSAYPFHCEIQKRILRRS